MGTESHYHSKKDRVFVRAITGHYKLQDELKRLRGLPRVRKGSAIRFVDGPQAYSRHYVEPEDGVTQTLHGAPTFEMIRTGFRSGSNTWMRRLPRSAT